MYIKDCYHGLGQRRVESCVYERVVEQTLFCGLYFFTLYHPESKIDVLNYLIVHWEILNIWCNFEDAILGNLLTCHSTYNKLYLDYTKGTAVFWLFYKFYMDRVILKAISSGN